ncbi:MAG: Wzt carbohydrate-binding domain-containing protein [Acidobacteriota bacterium]|nr:Wzt carbohydrate-binding domain-containing protein [Acidobacteriota bacterium]
MTGRETAIAFDRVVKNFRYFASPLQRVKEALHPLGKVYHTPLPVLRGVTFDIPRGQTVAVLGPNGVGKSTLLHLAAGVIEPSSGVVSVSGSLFSLLDLSGGFAPALTGRENVRFFHDVIAKRDGDRAGMERTVEAFAEIGEYFDRPLRTYSSGMLLRLAFAAAVAVEPDILLIDEVIAVGDARFQQKCFRRIRQLRERGTTILLVTHAAEVALGLCDRVLLFDRGELVFDGEPEAGVDRYYRLFFKVPERAVHESSADTLRYGAGGANIVRSFATKDEAAEASRVERGDRVTLVMEIEFERAVKAPHFGFSCSTKEGIRIYATTTALLGESPAPARAGERRRVEIRFVQSVAVSDLFVDLSVFEMEHGSVSILDARMGALHLAVTSSRYCLGMVDLDAAFDEATLRPGAAEPEPSKARAVGRSGAADSAGPRLRASSARAEDGPEVHT